ncbi:MAG: energy transducer TonB [Pseudomonadota bacterium]
MTKPVSTVLATLLLSLAAGGACAADQPAKIDASNCAKPEFPARWLSDGTVGQVTLAFLVGADGKVAESKVVESSGHSRIDRASERAAKSCSFKAGARNGQAAAGWAKVRYSWVAE